VWSAASDPIDAGMLPVRELEYAWRYLSPVHLLMEEGIEPFSKLLGKYTVCSAANDPMDSGMLPVRELEDNLRVARLVSALMVRGILPVREL
jgi:hypothetical protein